MWTFDELSDTKVSTPLANLMSEVVRDKRSQVKPLQIFRISIVAIPLRTPFTNALYKCPLQMPFTNALYKCPLQMPFTNALYKCPLQMPFTNALYKCPLRTPFTNALYECSPVRRRSSCLNEHNRNVLRDWADNVSSILAGGCARAADAVRRCRNQRPSHHHHHRQEDMDDRFKRKLYNLMRSGLVTLVLTVATWNCLYNLEPFQRMHRGTPVV